MQSKQERHKFFKIKSGGKEVGKFGLSFYDDIEAVGIGSLEVYPEYRGRGYGTKTINRIVGKYKDKYNLIYCFVDADNENAIRLYRKIGKVSSEANANGQYFVEFYRREENNMNLDESAKVTLTLGEIRRLVNESAGRIRNGEECDESVQGVILASILASLFAVGSIVRADSIKKSVPPNASQEQIQTAINKAGARTYGGFSAAQATNIVMRTIYQEGKGESPAGRKMIATVIWNRAGGDPDKFAEVCLKKSQFSVWNALEDRSPKGVSLKVPSGVTSNGQKKAVWDECKDLVESMFDGSFKPDGNYNAYLNKKKASNSAIIGWGAKMTGQIKVGNHTFGYLREKDGFRKPSDKTQAATAQQYVGTYKVKNGDKGVSFIAKDLISSGRSNYSNVKDLTNDIIKINKFKTDRNGNPIIRPGQEIKIPVA